MLHIQRSSLLLLLLHSCSPTRGCPAPCQCFMGVKAVCSEERMSTLPPSLPPQIRELIVILSGLTFISSNSLQGFPQLTSLALLNNPLKGVAPQAFHGLVALQELEISGNPRLESLEPGAFEKLGNLTKLMLNNNGLLVLHRGMFDRLPGLTTLQLRGNAFIWLPSMLFQQLPNLRSLDLSMNRIDNVEADLLTGLAQLESLKLGYNQISKLSWDTFKHVPELRALSLRSNNISDIPKGLFTSLTKLEELNLRDNQLTNVKSGSFPSSLKDLNLQGNHLSSMSLGSLPLLSGLVLSKNHITDLPWFLFRNLSSLELLDLSENQLLSLPRDIFTSLSKLKSVYLHGNNLTFVEPDVFRDQEGIERLTLSDNQLQSLPYGFFDPLLEASFVMTLRGNPWRCDCNITYLYNWLEFGAYLVGDLARVYCQNPPALKGQNLVSVERAQLVCAGAALQDGADTTQQQGRGGTSTAREEECVLRKSENGVYTVECSVSQCSNLTIETRIRSPGEDKIVQVWSREAPASHLCNTEGAGTEV